MQELAASILWKEFHTLVEEDHQPPDVRQKSMHIYACYFYSLY